MAIKKYEKSLVYLNRADYETDEKTVDSDSDSEKEEPKTEVEVKCDEKQQEVNKQECAILLNMSMCYLLLKNPSAADSHARRAIKADSKNPKGEYLRHFQRLIIFRRVFPSCKSASSQQGLQ